ncbi:hypothetical protein VSDG_07011 [Cytospora chrysosperma]|uniref:Uncharacterized protein n=1 Tax=Cytospora chrysosperma TaxID=252740 RepID=A0A423VRV2_CYTCH|nr:hypothetical protein VSDG_07011 [Valsa sordida]
MTDFIFNVDLSTTYIILRRDFLTPEDETGHLSSPIGAGFYYDAASANAAARAHCVKEAKETPNGLCLIGESAVHSERDGLYVGRCVTSEEVRDRFEVWVKRLKARGNWMRSGGGLEMVEGEAGSGGSRGVGGGGGGLAVVGKEGEEGNRKRERPETPLLRGSTGSKIGRLFSRKKTKA